MRYRIKIYMPVEQEEDVLYDSIEEAEREIEHLKLLHPDFKFEIEDMGEKELEKARN